jgi:hypothetical protein
VDSVPDPLLLRRSGSAGNRTRASKSVARNSVFQITEAIGVKNSKDQTSNILLREVVFVHDNCVRVEGLSAVAVKFSAMFACSYQFTLIKSLDAI